MDEYQLVRLIMALGGLLVMTVQLLIVGWDPRTGPIAAVLLVVGAHATWCRLSHVRTPRTMLALDVTLLGWVMVLVPDNVTVTTASLALLTLLVVLFSNGIWGGLFLAYLATWYGVSFFIAHGEGTKSISNYVSVMFTVGGVAVVMWRIKSWLARLDANRSQMLGTVSHELRNSLTGMIGITELVAADELDPDEVRELIGLANQQAQDAAEIVEDLLTAARIERSALHVDRTAVDLNSELATTVRRFAGEGVTIEMDLGRALPPADADALRVRQVLRNLLSNAVRYGGSSIGVRTEQDGPMLHLIVSDDGVGVPVEDEGTIFLPYRRSTTTHRDPGSVGLGLWICRQLAHAMGGDLRYRRVAARTEFVLALRRHGDDASVETPTQAALGSNVRESLSRLSDLVSRGSMFGGDVRVAQSVIASAARRV